jgi:hypothetical protein
MLLGYWRNLMAVPLSKDFWSWLDIIAIDRVSTIDNTPRATAGGVSYMRQTGDIVVPINEMKEFFEEECGQTATCERTLIEGWARRAETVGMHPVIAAVFQLAEVAQGAVLP